MVEIVVGFMIAWATGKARRIGSGADGLVDHAIDVVKQRLQNMITAKLGGDPAYQQLQLEASERDEVSERTETRVRLALEEAVEQDPRFAADLCSVVTELQATRTTGDRSVGTNNGIAGFDQSIVVTGNWGNVLINRQAEAPPRVDPTTQPPQQLAARVQAMNVDEAAWTLVELTRHIDGDRQVSDVMTFLPPHRAAHLLEGMEAGLVARVLSYCQMPGKCAAILLAMTRKRAADIMRATNVGWKWWWPVIDDMEPTTAVTFLEDVGLSEPVTFILSRLEPPKIVSIVCTLPAARQKAILDDFADRKQDDPNAKRIHTELRRHVRK